MNKCVIYCPTTHTFLFYNKEDKIMWAENINMANIFDNYDNVAFFINSKNIKGVLIFQINK